MLRHLLRLAWRRRRANALVALEIAASFLVLTFVGTIVAQFLLNARRPLGFQGKDLWVVTLSAENHDSRISTLEDAMRIQALLSEARACPGVVAAAASTNVPYDSSERNWQMRTDGVDIDAEFTIVTDDYLDVMGTEIVEGRWFGEQDRGSAFRPVVIDRDFARLLAPGESAVGKSLPRDGDDPDEVRVIGVVAEFRESGELSSPRPYFFFRKALDEDGGSQMENLVLRMEAGAPASLEPELLRRLRAVAPSWQFEVQPLANMRTANMRMMLVPLAAGGVVAGFLLLMVALGLVGVLWQNVSRRTREFALRRAVGASAGNVRTLVLGELAIVTSAAILAGSLVAAQAPLLRLIPWLQPSASALGLFGSAAAIMFMVMICGLYPSALAMRAEPAEALHYE